MNPVQLSITGSVAVVTLDQPARRNVLSREMVAGIVASLDEAEAHDQVRALVVAGSGKSFSAGAELDVLLSAADGDFAPVESVYDGFLRVLRSPLLTVGAIGGPAVGAGMNLALACDVRLAGPRAVFDTRFAQLRLHPGGGHMFLLQRAVGYQQAAAACLLSQTWSAEDAKRVGLVLDVVDDGLVEAAVRLASGLDGMDQAFARRMVASFRESAVLQDHQTALALETEAQRWSTTLPGFVSGVAAIKERIASA